LASASQWRQKEEEEKHQCQPNHGSEQNDDEWNRVSSSPFHVISVHHCLLRLEVRVFSGLFLTCFSNICTHSTVMMASKVNYGASNSKGVKKEHVTLTLMKTRDFKKCSI
jgi:hypothetical protein